MIIIEGTDKVGKDTLISLLKGYSSFDSFFSFKNERPKDTSKIELAMLDSRYKILYQNAVNNYPTVSVFNRSHFSEFVYSYIKRGLDRIKDKNLLELTEYVIRHDFLVIFLINEDLEEIGRRFKTDQEDYTRIGEVKRLNARYMKIFDRFKNLKVKVINCKGLTKFEVYKIAEEAIKEHVKNVSV